MTSNPLARAWLFLLLLSGASTVLAVLVAQGLSQTAIGAAILLVAWMKARVILSHYLGLRQAPAICAGVSWVLAFYCAALLGLYLVPAFTG